MILRHPGRTIPILFIALLLATAAAVAGGAGSPAATPRVLFPNGADSLLAGSDTTLLWDGTAPADTVQIDYSTNAGITWTTITTAGTGNRHRWSVPATLSTRCFLRITQRRPAEETWYWARTAGGFKPARMTAMAIDSGGNVITAGVFRDSAVFMGQIQTVDGDTTFSVFVAKYDVNGALLWVRRLDSPIEPSAADLAVSPDGTIHLVGGFREKLAFEDGRLIGSGPVNTDIAYAVSLTPAGALSWSGLSGVIGHADGVAVGPDGAIYISGAYTRHADFGDGVTLTGGNDLDVFLIRLGALGSGRRIEWAQRLERRHPTQDLDVTAPHRVAVDRADGVYLSGSFRDSIIIQGATIRGNLQVTSGYLARFRANGSVDWTRHVDLAAPYGVYDNIYALGLCFAPPDRLYLAGRFKGKITIPSDRTISSLGPDGFLLQFGTDGTPRWIRQLHDPSLSVLTGVAADAAGNAYVTGETWGGIDLGDGVTIPTSGNNDILIASFASSGAARWGRVRGTPSFEYGNAIAISPEKVIHIAGQFTGAVDLGAGVRLQNPMTSAPTGYSGFVAAYDPGIGTDEEIDVSDDLWTIYGETRFELAAGRATAMPGQIVTIPITLKDGGTLRQAGVDTLHATLLFIRSLLEPVSSEPPGVVIGREVVGDSLRLRLAIPVPATPVDTIVRLRFLAGLGDREETFLNWGELDAPSSASTIALRSGRFTLLGCESGGLRLVSMRGEGAKIAAASPDPATEGVSVTIATVEDGPTSLLLVDRLGHMIEEHPIDGRAGTRTLRIETAGLPSGTYTLVLRTPTDRIVRSLRVLR